MQHAELMCIAVGAPFDLAAARRLREDVLAARGAAFEVDLSAVQQVSTPGLQVLLAVARDVPHARFVGVSEPLLRDLERLGALIEIAAVLA